MDIRNIMKIVKDASGILSQRELANDVSVKGPADFVTEADKTIQEFIRAELELQYPDIPFLGEEGKKENIDFSSRLWVLDPVDGTTNLIHDYRASAISLALLEKQEPVLAIIYQPYTKEMFWAEKGKGAYLGDAQIHVSKASGLWESIVSVGTSPYRKDLADQNFAWIKEVFLKSQDIRRSGSAAIDLAMVAAGRTDAFLERNLKLWDFAAGWLLIKEAGGAVTDFSGEALKTELSGDVVTGTEGVVRELLEILKEGREQC